VWSKVRSRREVVLAAAVLAVVVAAGALLVSAFTTSREPDDAAIRVSDVSCADEWSPPHSGVRTFAVRNEGHNAMDVELLSAGALRVYGSLEVIAPGVTRQLVVRLPTGRFQWKCDAASGATLISKAEAVTGRPQHGVTAAAAVTQDDLTPIATAVRDQTLPALEQLAAETDVLSAAVTAGRLDDARADWLTAHLAYERLGVAYGTFGDFDAKIDGRPDGLVAGVDDPHWTGFLRLERGLWGGEPVATLTSVAGRLAADVHALVADFPNEFTDLRDVPLRAHEILENTLEFQLTGDADQGSHTVLATARANVDGTLSVLGAVEPLLQSRAPKLAADAERSVNGLGALLDSYRRADGSWLGLSDLSPQQHEVLDARFGAVLETLAPVPDVLELPRDAGQD
jgi:high-affinity iron transporter